MMKSGWLLPEALTLAATAQQVFFLYMTLLIKSLVWVNT